MAIGKRSVSVLLLLFSLGCGQDQFQGQDEEPWLLGEEDRDKDEPQPPPPEEMPEQTTPPTDPPTPANNQTTPIDPPIEDPELEKGATFVRLLDDTCAQSQRDEIVCWEPAKRELVDALGLNDDDAPRFEKILIRDETLCGLTLDQRLWCGSTVRQAWAQEATRAFATREVTDIAIFGDTGREPLHIATSEGWIRLAIDQDVGDALARITTSGEGDPIQTFPDTTGIQFGLIGWGLTTSGKVRSILSNEPTSPFPEDLEFTQLAQDNTRRICGVTTTGALYCNERGITGRAEDASEIELPEGVRARQILFESQLLRVVTEDGRVFATDDFDEVSPGARIQVTQYKAGEPSCALDDVGEIYCHGGPSSYEWLFEGQPMSEAAPVEVALDVTFTKLASTSTSVCGLSEAGDVYCWGSIGGLDTARDNIPRKIQGWSNMTDLVAGTASYCARANSGDWHCSSTGGLRSKAHSGNAARDHERPVTLPEGVVLSTVSINRERVAGLDTQGRAFWWGYKTQRQPGVVEEVPGKRWEHMILSEYALCGVTLEQETHCVSLESGEGKRVRFPQEFGTPVEFAAALNPTASAPPLPTPICARDAAGAVACWDISARGPSSGGDTLNASSIPNSQPATHIYFRGSSKSLAEQAPICMILADNKRLCQGQTAEAFPGGALSQTIEHERFGCGLDDEGIAYCWGDDARQGVLGRALPLSFSEWEWARAWSKLAR